MPQSLNRYAYVHGNPVNHTDPSGHFAWFLIGFLALMAIGVASSSAEQNAEIRAGTRLPQHYSVSEALVKYTPVSGTFRAFTGTDPVSLERLTAAQQAFEIGMLALDLAPAAGEIAGMVRATRAARAGGGAATVLSEGLGVAQTAKRALSTADELSDASRVMGVADNVGAGVTKVEKAADEVIESATASGRRVDDFMDAARMRMNETRRRYGFTETSDNVVGMSGKTVSPEVRDEIERLVRVLRKRELSWDPARGRFIAAEGEAGYRLEAQIGRRLRRAESGPDFIDIQGTTYDLVGAGLKSEHFKFGEFTDQIMLHLPKADRTVLDVSGLSRTQADSVRNFVNELTREQRFKIRFLR